MRRYFILLNQLTILFSQCLRNQILRFKIQIRNQILGRISNFQSKSLNEFSQEREIKNSPTTNKDNDSETGTTKKRDTEDSSNESNGDISFEESSSSDEDIHNLLQKEVKRIKKKEKRKEKEKNRPNSYEKELLEKKKNPNLYMDKKTRVYGNNISEGSSEYHRRKDESEEKSYGIKTKPKMYNQMKKNLGSHYQGKVKTELNSSKLPIADSDPLPEYKSIKDLFAQTFSFGRK